ncbi:MAG TPA: NAD(P)/FAD-dependent oxidoreductase [Dehalococcoidia bacterium]|nr:NAD(P)/FAD-dependent oxidoreductase [Dehalococcoidia bacterium]
MKVCVIGGGVAGMTTAYRLMQAGHQVALYEAGDELGGLVRTFEVGGSRLEAYYHHLFSTDTTIISLIQELGFGDRLRWIDSKVGWFSGGRLYPLVTPIDLLKFAPLPPIDRLKLGLMGLRLRRRDDWAEFERITAKDWIEQNVSKAVFDKFWGVMLYGKYGEAYDQIAMAWLWSKIHLRFQSRQGVSQREQLCYLMGSFAVYIEEMAQRLRDGGVDVRTSTPVQRITAEGNRATGIVLADGTTVAADAVVAAVPSSLFRKMAPPLTPEYDRQLGAVGWQAAVCMVLTMKHSLSPIYWMNIGDRSLPFLAIVEHTNFVGPEHYGGNHILYISNYLRQDHQYMAMSEDELWALYEPALKKINPAFSADWVTQRWLFKAPFAQPIIKTGYSADKPDHRTPVDGLYLETMTQIYPEDRGQNYSIKMGEDVAKMVVEDYEKRAARPGAAA